LFEKDGIEWGARLGYDWQMDSFVVGLLAEFDSHNINDSVSAFSITPARYTMTRELNWSAAARVRAGVAMPEALVYVTGGLARADVDHTQSTSNTVNSFTLRGGGGTSGYQYGAGLDWAMTDDWRVGAEFLRTKLDDDDHRLRVGNTGTTVATNPFLLRNASGTDFARSDDKFTYSTIRLTLTFKFGS
jgi:opacity protein-like surface antigen